MTCCRALAMPMATAAATAGDAAALALRLQLLANFSQELLCLFDSEQQLLCFNASRNKLGARVAKQLSLTASSCEMGPRASLAQLLGAVLGEREGMACYLTLQDGLTSDSVGERSASAHDGHGHAYEVSAARCQDPATSKQNAIKLSIRAASQERCHVTSEIGGMFWQLVGSCRGARSNLSSAWHCAINNRACRWCRCFGHLK